jgi:hypothetical protein
MQELLMSVLLIALVGIIRKPRLGTITILLAVLCFGILLGFSLQIFNGLLSCYLGWKLICRLSDLYKNSWCKR